MGSLREGKASRRDEPKPNPAHCPVEEPEMGPTAFTMDGADEDRRLRFAGSLTREEVLRRRSRRLKQLARFYIRQYWALMEEVRVKHRDYYWEYGVSPFQEDEEEEVNGGGMSRAAEENDRGMAVGGWNGTEEDRRARVGVRLGFGKGEGSVRKREERKRCAFPGCKSKAMPLTRYCHPHILADNKQTLYKACMYVTKSCGQSGPITCGKPILRAAVPSLCHIHLQKSRRSTSQALRKAGAHIFSSGRSDQLFDLLSECVLGLRVQRVDVLDSLDSSSTDDQMDVE